MYRQNFERALLGGGGGIPPSWIHLWSIVIIIITSQNIDDKFTGLLKYKSSPIHAVLLMADMH